MIYRGATLTGINLDIDLDEFYECTLFNCTLRYSGGSINLHNTVTTGCAWSLEGPARSTIDLLRYINSTSGGPYVVDQFIDHIRTPYSSSGPLN